MSVDAGFTGSRRPDASARFLYVHTSRLEPTVIDSQVVDAIVAAGAAGVRFDMSVLLHGGAYVRNWSYTQRRRREIEARIPGIVRLHLTPFKKSRLGDWIGTAQLWADVARAGTARTVIHARGDTSAFFAAGVRRLGRDVRYVYDVRGDYEAEYLYHSGRDGVGERERAARLAGIERHRSGAIRHADHVWCVSSVLRDRLHARYGCPLERMSVIPCVADEGKFHLDERDREKARQELGVQDRFVVVFPGRLGNWHSGQEMLALVQRLMKAHDDVFFLVLTPDVEQGRRLAGASLPDGRYRVLHAPHAEVPRYLRAADLGLLLREPHPLNEVACPTKFGEYVLCGVPVLISDGIGDCSPFVREHEAGAVLSSFDPEPAVHAVEALRKRASAQERARIAGRGAGFSRGRATQEMVSVYRRLAST